MVNLQKKTTVLVTEILHLREFASRNEVHKFGVGCIPIRTREYWQQKYI